ncbi:MAG: response regulator [Pirellulales bacterium]
MSTVGALLLWFSWFGFNGGSALALTESVPLVMLNTTLAAAAGGLAALIPSWRQERRADVGHVINGVIGGLVAVTAGCNILAPWAAVVIGGVAGVLSVAGTYWLEHRRIDDVVGAIPVHGMCGIWGTLAVALFGDPMMFPHHATRMTQFGVQFLGVSACGIWSFGMAWFVLCPILRRVGFRVSREAELHGLNVSEHGASTELHELLVNMDRHYRAGDFRTPVPVEPHTEVGQIAAEYNRVIRRASSEIRAREEAAAAARTAEEKYRSIFENAVEGMFQTTPDGRYLSANPALARIYGYQTPDELMKSLDQIDVQLYVEAGRRDDFRTMVERDGMVRDFESAVRCRDGSIIWISENARAIRDARGNVICYEGTVVDVTSKRQASLLQAEKDAAETANRTKSEFLANMSHEIRTPLNGVMGMLELLGTTQLDSKQKRFVHLAQSSSDALLGLINQLLDFSKIEAGKVELERIEFRLHPMIEDLAEVFAHKAQKKGVELACRIRHNVPDVVLGDPERVRQVLVNLTNNAIKFTDLGEVRIEVSCEGDQDAAKLVRFAVFDSGIGVPADRRDRLFQPFTQVDASTTRKYGGTGLGLSICKQLVEAMGGSIEYVERPEGGSIFQFTLPLEPTEQSAPASRLLPHGLRKIRVLAVDDVEANRELLVENFARWGVEIDTADDGLAALEKAKLAAAAGNPYGLLVLDRRLPDLDGLDLAERLHTDSAYADSRILLLTSLSDSPDSTELKRLGISNVMSKPIRQSQLFDAVVAAARQRETRSIAGTVAATAETAVREHSQPAPSGTPGRRILVAEDNDVNQLVTEEILRSAGYECRIVDNGRAALEALDQETFALVLMDCQMPEMDGFTAVGELRKREAAGRRYAAGPLPVVALTANAVRGDRELCINAGMTDYTTKPIDRLKLLEIVARLMPAAEPTAPIAAEPAMATKAGETIDLDSADEATVDQWLADAFRVDDLLSRCQGDKAFATRLLEKFRNRLPGDLAAISEAAASGDREALRSRAHQLKGCAKNLGAEKLGLHVGVIEAEATSGAELTLNTAVERLHGEVEDCLNRVDLLIQEFQQA